MKFSKIIIIMFIIFYNNYGLTKTCLTEHTNLNNLKFQREPETGQFVNVWIVTDDTPSYDCFKNERNVKRRLTMRNRYRVLQDNFNIRRNGNWSLLVQTDNEKEITENICGWVSHDHIIVKNQPIKNYYTGIYQKALIKEGDSNNVKALKVYNDRNLEMSKEAIEVRTIFYVYDFYPRTARNPESEDTKSLLIGVNPLLDTTASNAPLLIGWIDQKKVTFWNSRTAFEFPVGQKGKIYKNGNKIFETTEEIKTPLSYKELRNPILKDMGNEYLVGSFSRLTKDNFEIRKKIEQLKTGLEVLFVIDGTRSMTTAFKEVLEGVKKTAQALNTKSIEKGLETPRFALMFYRDHATRKKAVRREGRDNVEVNIDYCSKETTCFPMGNIRNFTYKLQNHIACDSDETVQESMYVGLIEGVKSCSFDTGEDGAPKRMRMIIHLGDAGNNGRGNYTPSDVSLKFKEYHIFKYISVNVSGNDISEFNDSIINISFGKNKTYHINQLVGLRKKIIEILDDFLNINTNDLQRQIKILAKGFAINEMKYHKYAKGFGGTTQGRIGVVSDEILEYAKKVIKANNISLKGYNAFQQYVEGEIPKSTPIKEYLLISRTNIETITNALTKMHESRGSKEKRQKVWNDSLKIILGDQSCEENEIQIPFDECSKRRKGIPIKAGFMRYTKKHFINLEGDILQKVFCEVIIARDTFRAFIDNKYIHKVIIKNKDICSFKAYYNQDINGDKKIITDINDAMVDKYFFKEGELEEMAWIPLKHFSFIIEEN